MFGDSEFMREVDEECLRMREAEREAARRGEEYRNDPHRWAGEPDVRTSRPPG